MKEKLFQLSGHLRIVALTSEACDELAAKTLARINLIEPCAHLEIESAMVCANVNTSVKSTQ